MVYTCLSGGKYYETSRYLESLAGFLGFVVRELGLGKRV